MVLDFNTEIEMLLYDESKIVTYKLINQKFNITPKEAKIKLNDFVEKSRSNDSINLVFYITYLVIAQNKDTKKSKIVLVNQQDIDKFSLENKVISKQIYSIQKNFIEDFSLIYGSDLNASSDLHRKSNLNTIADCIRDGSESKPCTSVTSSTSSESIKKATVDIKQLTVKAESKVPAEATEKAERKVTESKASVAEEVKQEKVLEKGKDTAKKSGTNNIAAMFGKQKENPPKKYPERQIDTTASDSSTAKSSSSSDSIASIVVKETKKAKEIREIIEDMDILDDDDEAPEETKKKDKKKKETKNKEVKKKVQEKVEAEEKPKSDVFDDEAGDEMEVDGTQKQKSDEEEEEEDEYEDEQINKKRRRKTNKKNVQVINSDDEDGDKEQKSKKPRAKKPNNNKEIDKMFNKENDHAMDTGSSGSGGTGVGKKKQLVTKTFTDADGYEVTQKVWETVDDDTPVTVKSESVENTKKEERPLHEAKKPHEHSTAKSTKPLNQPTLANFFKKK